MVKTLSICLGRSRVGCASKMDDRTICQGTLGGLSLTRHCVSFHRPVTGSWYEDDIIRDFDPAPQEQDCLWPQAGERPSWR